MQDKDAIVANKLVKYCNAIARYIHGMDEQTFFADDKTVSACAFCLGQIGELAKQASDGLKTHFPQIPWHKMYGLRNRIVHDYEGVDMSQIWAIVAEDIPKVEAALKTTDRN